MDIRIIRGPLEAPALKTLAEDTFGEMVKIVVDIRRDVMAVGGDLHADGEARLLEDGSLQDDVWGANVFPWKRGEARLQYTAMINIRPRLGNAGMVVVDPNIRAKMRALVDRWLPAL